MALRLSLVLLASWWLLLGAVPAAAGSSERTGDHLKRAKVFLAAGDYRRALDACLQQVTEAPSAEHYLYVTYVLQAIDGYLEHLAKTDRWVGVEQLYANLTFQGPQDLVDPPEVLARIAKEIIQDAIRRQSDVTAAMAARLDQEVTARLWKQQTAWRAAKPDRWWAGVPEEWNW
ncbi:hypothetical protein [Candidatus Nitrospira bockiana]